MLVNVFFQDGEWYAQLDAVANVWTSGPTPESAIASWLEAYGDMFPNAIFDDGENHQT